MRNTKKKRAFSSISQKFTLSLQLNNTYNKYKWNHQHNWLKQ